MNPEIQELVNAAKESLRCKPGNKYPVRVRLQKAVDSVTESTESHIKNIIERFSKPIYEDTQCLCHINKVKRLQELEALETIFEVWKGTQ